MDVVNVFGTVEYKYYSYYLEKVSDWKDHES
jgi:hypothetical protein